MKLSEIVAYINLLDTLSADAEVAEAVRCLDSILHVVFHHEIQMGNHGKNLLENFESINSGIHNFIGTLHSLKHTLNVKREEQEPEYLRESQRWFDHEQPFETNEYILNRRLGIDDESNIALRARLRNLSDWHCPGMIIRPGLENFIEDLVPLDPLYLVDTHEELLKPSVSQFTMEYQRRLREYIIDDRGRYPIFWQLPTNQFGFVFAYNYFNYRPMKVIQQYLTELYDKLRPGGTLIMTYNNCDRAQGVGLSERHFMCYTPRRMIVQYAESVGFELERSHDALGDLSWLELRKPGEITSMRGGQTLAKIIVQSK